MNQYVIVGKFIGWKSDSIFLVQSQDHRHNQAFVIPFCTSSDHLLETFKTNIKENQIVGIRGFIGLNENNRIVLYADKVSFLGSTEEV